MTPKVFKKERQQTKSKGVDIALATDVLSNAFLDNYDAAVLTAGDGDYEPVVDEVKRLGKIVYLVFFEKTGLSRRLKLSSDRFFPLDDFFIRTWKEQVDRKGIRVADVLAAMERSQDDF